MDLVSEHLVNERYRSRVPREKVLQRAHVLTCCFLRIKKHLLGLTTDDYDEIKKVPGVYLNSALLVHALYSYWYDVFRLRDFHAPDGKLINKPKKAAYLLKWIIATKPISFDPDKIADAMQKHLLIRINEIFALRVGLLYAGIPLKLIDYGAPAGDLADKFTYNLAFRGADAGFVSLWFESVLHFHGLQLE